MACRIGDTLIQATLDCTVPGRVTGALRLNFMDEPIRLDLAGDAEPDLAGRRIVITNPIPGNEEGAPLTTEQAGEVIFFTLSHRMRLARGERAASAPLRNVVYLEWNSSTNGRVVVSAGNWKVEVEEVVPVEPVSPRPHRAGRPPFAHRSGGGQEPDLPMDEFQWERSMREADEMVDTYAQLEREFDDHPEKEKLVARAMGWTWMEDPAVQDALSEPVEDPPAPEEDQQSFPPLVPNPATEGEDWIKTDDGDIRHPLAHRALTFAIGIWRDLHPKRGEGEFPPLHPDLTALQFNIQSLSAKLAGALNDVMYDYPPEGGFITAYLKRALGYLNQAANTLELVTKKELLDPMLQVEYKQTLLGFRQEILKLMDKYRKVV